MFPPDLIRLAEKVLAAACERQLRIATAESCTGGLIAACLTEIPGSSDVMECGFVVYSDEAKSALLGVPAELIDRYGAVSEEVARAMSEGALKRCRAQVCIAVTGIAGPAGGSLLKPVGLVHIAIAFAGRPVERERHRFGDIGRDQVRLKTVEAALRLLLRGL